MHYAQDFDAVYAAEKPPAWDIGRPQPAFKHLADKGALIGRILDAGCGTGEHALMAASLGLEALGFDVSERAIELAKQKAKERSLAARFLVADACALPDLDQHFDTVLDCGLFHVLGDDDQERYVMGLTEVTAPGGRFHMLCFSDSQPGDWGPRRTTQADIRMAFSLHWDVERIEPDVIDLTWNPEGALAWLVTATRH